MLTRRLIPVLYIQNGLIVRSEGFKIHQNIGNVIEQAKRYNEWNIDELIYIDISKTQFYDIRRDDMRTKNMSSILDIVSAIANICFIPLTFGGGIRTVQQAEALIRNGADKITLNTGALQDHTLISRISKSIGSQAVVMSIDYRMHDKMPMVYAEHGSVDTGWNVFDWARKCQDEGAGELFLNCIDRDGIANGYDIDTLYEVDSVTSLPVIGCGGAGDDLDFLEVAQKTSIYGIAAGNFFHFTERSYPRVKKLLYRKGINVRA